MQQQQLKLFKNASVTWLKLGSLGPFPLGGDDDDHKHYDVRVVECQPSNILNIQGSSVLRFEPQHLVFTSENVTTESSRAANTIDVFLHASYPVTLTFPKSECQVWNRTFEEHAQAMKLSLLHDNDDDHDHDDEEEWKLVSHFGPLTSKIRPGVNRTNVYSCRATKKGLKVEPSRFVWDSTNYTQAVYVPHFVHYSSYPDDQAIPPPKCSFRRDVPIDIQHSNTASENSSTIYFSNNPLLQIIGMILILVAIAVLSFLYMFPTTKKNNNKSKEEEGEEEETGTESKKKRMPPLTFSQKLFQQHKNRRISNPGQMDGPWTIVEGPGSRNLMIQWVDDETFVTKLVPKKKKKDNNNNNNNSGKEKPKTKSANEE